MTQSTLFYSLCVFAEQMGILGVLGFQQSPPVVHSFQAGPGAPAANCVCPHGLSRKHVLVQRVKVKQEQMPDGHAFMSSHFQFKFESDP